MKRGDFLMVILVTWIAALVTLGKVLVGDWGILLGCVLGYSTTMYFLYYMVTHEKLNKWADEKLFH